MVPHDRVNCGANHVVNSLDPIHVWGDVLNQIIGDRNSIWVCGAENEIMTTVLIVDDSQTLRHMLSELLQDDGMTVLEAINGVDAKEKIQRSHLDLVITDLVMPQMNGYELCRWIKSDPLYKNLPVLVCTTKSEEFDRYWGMKQGADAYITKPFHPPELVRTVRQLLESLPH